MSALTRAQKLLTAPGLAVLAKYHLRNQTPVYNVYYLSGRNKAALLAPEYVLIRDHAGYEIRRLEIQGIDEREGTVIAACRLDGRTVELLAENLADLLERGEGQVAVSAEGSLLHRYTRPAGLFNYYEENGEFQLHYHPDFGRGEHAEFFNFWQRNLYGVFTPDSFIEIKPISREHSREIYRELRDARVLNRRGHLRSTDLLEAHEFRHPAARGQSAGIKHFLSERPRRLQAERQFAELVAKPEPVIKEQLTGLQIIEPDDDGNGARKHLAEYSPDHRRILLQLYVERIAAAEVAEQIAKNRGIVKKNEKGDVLLLLSDEVATSSPFYGPLYKFGRSLAGPGKTHIAYAYRTPFPRGPHPGHHPLVEAIRDFEKLQAVDGLEDDL